MSLLHPRVSVIIPTYNRVHQLRRAVTSVLEQTFKSFEIIVIDDGSTVDISKRVRGLDHRIRVIRQKHSGSGNARNLSMLYASGEYLAFLDDDDLFLPNKLLWQVNLMDTNPQIALSHTSYEKIDTENNHLEVVHSGQFSGKVYPNIMLDCPIATPTVMVRHGKLNHSMRFGENLSFGEDIILWTRISKENEIIGLDEPLTQVIVSKETAAQSNEKQLTACVAITNYCISDNPSLGVIRRKLLAKQRCYRGHLFAQQKHIVPALRQYLAALLLWPTNKGIIYALVSLILRKRQ